MGIPAGRAARRLTLQDAPKNEQQRRNGHELPSRWDVTPEWGCKHEVASRISARGPSMRIVGVELGKLQARWAYANGSGALLVALQLLVHHLSKKLIGGPHALQVARQNT